LFYEPLGLPIFFDVATKASHAASVVVLWLGFDSKIGPTVVAVSSCSITSIEFKTSFAGVAIVVVWL
jgi:hypothetical protein